MTFTADINAFVEKAKAKLQQAPRDIISAVAADLVMNTPVDKGFLRGAWSASTTGTATIGNVIADPTGSATIARLQAAAQAIEIGDVFVIQNRVNYGGFVEYGTVHMAPRAFVRGTLARAPAIAGSVIATMR